VGLRRSIFSLRGSVTVFLSLFLLVLGQTAARADTASFDLIGPKVEVRVQRAGQTLPISQVPNLQAGDRLWVHADLPDTQSVHYLMVVAFLRGATNPPPDSWFTRVETWNKPARDEGVFVDDFFCAVCSAPSDVAKEMMAKVARAAAENLIMILLVARLPACDRVWPPDRKRSEVISYTNSSQRRELSLDEKIVRINGNLKVYPVRGREHFRNVSTSVRFLT